MTTLIVFRLLTHWKKKHHEIVSRNTIIMYNISAKMCLVGVSETQKHQTFPTNVIDLTHYTGNSQTSIFNVLPFSQLSPP